MSGQVLAESTSPDTGAERRQWGRFVVDVGKLVVTVASADHREAQVLDESFGGVGLAVDDARDIVPGRSVDLDYDGVPMRGTVRFVQPHGEGRWRIGIEWQTSRSYDLATRDGLAQIRGRLRAVFRTWESGRWHELARAVAFIEHEADALQLEPVAQHAAELLKLLEETHPPATATPEALVALVIACLNAARDVESAT